LESQVTSSSVRLRDVIRNVLSKGKESNYLLVQKYDFAMAQSIRSKVKGRYEEMIRAHEETKEAENVQ
jgi:hypothetical protein